MSDRQPRTLRPELTEDEHRGLRIIAAQRYQTLAGLTRDALATAPATREAFQTKDGHK